MKTLDEIEAIEVSAKRVQTMSKYLARLFLVAFWLILVASIAIFFLMLTNGIVDFSSKMAAPSLFASIKFLLEMLTIGVITWVLKAMFCDMAKGISPFNTIQSRRLKIASILMLLHAACVASTSPAFLSILGLDELLLGASIGPASAEGAMRFIPINAGDIVLAIVLFCAALIVEYGSLLQKLSDDTL